MGNTACKLTVVACAHHGRGSWPGQYICAQMTAIATGRYLQVLVDRRCSLQQEMVWTLCNTALYSLLLQMRVIVYMHHCTLNSADTGR